MDWHPTQEAQMMRSTEALNEMMRPGVTAQVMKQVLMDLNGEVMGSWVGGRQDLQIVGTHGDVGRKTVDRLTE